MRKISYLILPQLEALVLITSFFSAKSFYSSRLPRVINKMCSSCLIIGNSKELNLIDADTVILATNESELD